MTKFFSLMIVLALLMISCGKNNENKSQNQAQPSTQVAQAAKEVPQKTIQPVTGTKLTEFAQSIVTSSTLSKMATDETVTVPLTITNTSTQTWTKGTGIHAYYQWLDSKRKDVGRPGGCYFPKNVLPNESVEVKMKIKAPEKSGEYTLKISMVQEDVAVFDAKGCSPLELKISVK